MCVNHYCGTNVSTSKITAFTFQEKSLNLNTLQNGEAVLEIQWPMFTLQNKLRGHHTDYVCLCSPSVSIMTTEFHISSVIESLCGSRVQFICGESSCGSRIQFICSESSLGSQVHLLLSPHVVHESSSSVVSLCNSRVQLICCESLCNSRVQFICCESLCNSRVQFICCESLYNSRVQFICCESLCNSWVQFVFCESLCGSRVQFIVSIVGPRSVNESNSSVLSPHVVHESGSSVVSPRVVHKVQFGICMSVRQEETWRKDDETASSCKVWTDTGRWQRIYFSIFSDLVTTEKLAETVSPWRNWLRQFYRGTFVRYSFTMEKPAGKTYWLTK